MRTLDEDYALMDFEVIEGGQSADKIECEEKIESRVRALTEATEGFITSLPAALLAGHPASRDIIEELAVKLSALQWIVRVAKRCEGTIRKKLWSDVNQCLTGLEKTAEQMPHLEVTCPNSRSQTGHDWSAESPDWT
jgi:hypothetical protein